MSCFVFTLFNIHKLLYSILYVFFYTAEHGFCDFIYVMSELICGYITDIWR